MPFITMMGQWEQVTSDSWCYSLRLGDLVEGGWWCLLQPATSLKHLWEGRTWWEEGIALPNFQLPGRQGHATPAARRATSSTSFPPILLFCCTLCIYTPILMELDIKMHASFIIHYYYLFIPFLERSFICLHDVSCHLARGRNLPSASQSIN